MAGLSNIIIFLIFLVLTPINAYCNGSHSIMILTKEYVESFEWEINISVQANKFAKYEEVYIKKIESDVKEDIFLASVMLGILKSERSKEKLKTIKNNDPLVKIGVAFALCMLNHNYRENIEYLFKIGKAAQDAGGARSLRYLEAVELLSIINDDKFINYASSLVTDEAYQTSAIKVAVMRHKALFGKNRK